MEHGQEAANEHFQTTKETWSGLAAELGVVKTIYSSSKFIYLNRFFYEGSEVITHMKIFARADREIENLTHFYDVFNCKLLLIKLLISLLLNLIC